MLPNNHQLRGLLITADVTRQDGIEYAIVTNNLKVRDRLTLSEVVFHDATKVHNKEGRVARLTQIKTNGGLHPEMVVNSVANTIIEGLIVATEVP